jgi:hypothetical protein
MSTRQKIQRIIDQLAYNGAYAPDYPSEDNTSMDREAALIRTELVELISSTRREDVGRWLTLSLASVDAAFAKFQGGDGKAASRDIQFAEEYLRNAQARSHTRLTLSLSREDLSLRLLTPRRSRVGQNRKWGHRRCSRGKDLRIDHSAIHG